MNNKDEMEEIVEEFNEEIEKLNERIEELENQKETEKMFGIFLTKIGCGL